MAMGKTALQLLSGYWMAFYPEICRNRGVSTVRKCI